jgi:hypothetical protein
VTDTDLKTIKTHETARNYLLDRDHFKNTRVQRTGDYARAIMFILIGVAALLFSARVSAEQLAHMPNQAGGDIVLTTDRLPSCGGNLLAWSHAPGGEVITGCWFAEGSYVTIRWSGTGTLRVFRIADFTLFRPEPNGQIVYK